MPRKGKMRLLSKSSKQPKGVAGIQEPLSSNTTDSSVLKILSHDPTLNTLIKGSKSPNSLCTQSRIIRGKPDCLRPRAGSPTGEPLLTSHLVSLGLRLSRPPPSRFETGLTTTILGLRGRSEFCERRSPHRARPGAPGLTGQLLTSLPLACLWPLRVPPAAALC